MLQINISTQPIRLEYSINNAKLNRQTTLPKVQIETTKASVEIDQSIGELTIDQYPCRYSIGFRNNADLAQENASRGRQAALDTIGRIAQEGDQLSQTKSKTNVIAQISANSTISEVPDITYARISSPDIRYQAKPVQFTPQEGTLDIKLVPGTINGDYQPGKVDIQITQYPSVEISTVDVKV